MKIMSFAEKPIHRIQFLNAAKHGRTKSEILSMSSAFLSILSQELEAILVTGDLQGVVKDWQNKTTRLLGAELAHQYAVCAEQGLVPPCEKVGVILAGDLYAAPDGAKRGASGDVRPVWEKFAQNFRWVAGVQGNHDRFGTPQEEQEFKKLPNLNLLDCEVIQLDHLSIGGVSGIIGDPIKPGRKDERDFLSALKLVLEQNPDILVLHHGPSGNEGQRGNSLIREAIEQNPPSLTICGHVHWDMPLASLSSDAQILNVDSRALILQEIGRDK